MRFRSLSVASGHTSRPRRSLYAGTPLAPFSRRASLRLVIGTTLCAGALLAAPGAVTPVWAAPTVGRDEGGPQVQILAPAYQDTLKGRFRISVGIKSTKFNPQSIEFFVDDRSATKGPVPIAAFPSMSFDWNTRDFADGPHKLTVRVTDTQGFRGWAEVNVYINNGRKVDSLPPTLVWKNIEQFQTLSGVAQVELDAVDNFGVKWLMVSINPVGRSGELATKAAPRQWLLNRPPYIAKFDTTAVPDGLYAFTAKAWDSTDQQGDAQSLTVGVVNNALNATNIEGMLNGLRADDVAMSPNRTPKTSDSRVVSESKPAPMGLLPEPEAVAGYGIFDDRAPATSSGASAARASAPSSASPPNASSTKAAPLPAQTRRPTPQTNAAPPKVAVTKSAPQARQGVRSAVAPAQSKTPQAAPSLQPSPPALVARALETPTPTRVDESAAPQIAANSFVDAAQPELSLTRGASSALSGPQPIEAEITVSARPRIARLDAASRAVETDAVENETEVSNLDAEINADALSRLDAPELAVSAPVAPLETPNVAPAPRSSAPRLSEIPAESPQIARLDAEPIASAAASDAAMMSRGASRETVPSAPVRVALATESNRAGRIASPATNASPATTREEPQFAGLGTNETSTNLSSTDWVGPQLSAPQIASELKRSNGRLGELVSAARARTQKAFERVVLARAPFAPKPAAQNHAAKAPKKAAASKTTARVAALPRSTREDGIISDVPSITVAPLEVSAPLRTPRVHRVHRTTTLRAVAARYGFPVELVAASNGWPVEMRVIKGMTVQLPRPLQVSMGGEPLVGTPALLAGDTGVAAFRFLFEQAGGTLRWDAKTKRVIARKGGSEIVLSIGSKVARVDNKEVMMELAAFLFEGRTMIPLRFWEEGLKAQVEWDPQTGRIVVAMTG